MGNCFPYIPFFSNNHSDLARLSNSINERRHSTSFETSVRSSSGSRRRSSRSNDDITRQRYQRNLQPSSYVNELYINAAGDDNDLNGTVAKALDEKRRTRVQNLLEQLSIDHFVKGGNGDEECAICMADFDVGDPIRYLPCMHSYHVVCIDDWLLRSFTCPSCMEPVDSAILSAFTVNYGAGTNLASLPCSTSKQQ